MAASSTAGDMAGDTFQTIVSVPGIDIPSWPGRTSRPTGASRTWTSSPAASASGTVNLGLMGSGSTAKLRYVFPSGYEVKSGAAMTIADGVNVYISNLQTIAVDAGATLTVGADRS